MISAAEALERLMQGNRRFVTGQAVRDISADHSRRMELVEGQNPFAIVLGCSDSRVPAELVFDQGLGDLFVIRVAGNIVAPSQIGSIEFAAEQFGVRLVVVMGHSRCGAVLAALEELERPGNSSPNLGFIVNRIRTSLGPLLEPGEKMTPESMLGPAVKANISASVDQLRTGSRILEKLIRDDGLVVVGAEYSLASGEVDFLEDEIGSAATGSAA